MKSIKLIFTLLLICFLYSTGEAKPKNSIENCGQIKGKLVDQDTGQPIEIKPILFRLFEKKETKAERDKIQDHLNTKTKVKTYESGEFSFTNVLPGRYGLLRFNKEKDEYIKLVKEFKVTQRKVIDLGVIKVNLTPNTPGSKVDKLRDNLHKDKIPITGFLFDRQGVPVKGKNIYFILANKNDIPSLKIENGKIVSPAGKTNVIGYFNIEVEQELLQVGNDYTLVIEGLEIERELTWLIPKENINVMHPFTFKRVAHIDGSIMQWGWRFPDEQNIKKIEKLEAGELVPKR